MKLYTKEEYDNKKFKDIVNLQCDQCKSIFLRTKKEEYLSLKRDYNKDFCSRSCHGNFKVTSKTLNCKTCNKEFFKTIHQIKVTKNNFCCHSCAAIYNNTHKKYGTRISKLEIWLQKELPLLYPSLTFKFNSKEEINSES